MKIDRTNKNWTKDISDEEIFNREFSIGYLLQTNTHIPFIAELKEKVLSTYIVVAKFTYLGYNGDALHCNGQRLVYADSKFDKHITVSRNVIMLSGDLRVCGSNKYPAIASREGQHCIIKFTSYGLPYVDRTNGWSIELISIDKI